MEFGCKWNSVELSRGLVWGRGVGDMVHYYLELEKMLSHIYISFLNKTSYIGELSIWLKKINTHHYYQLPSVGGKGGGAIERKLGTIMTRLAIHCNLNLLSLVYMPYIILFRKMSSIIINDSKQHCTRLVWIFLLIHSCNFKPCAEMCL